MATRTIIFVSVLLLGTCLAKRRSEQRMSDEEYNRLFPDDCDSCKGNNVLLPECNVCNKITLLTQDTVFFNSSADVSWRNAPETAGFEKVETVEEGSKEEADMSIMSGTKKEFWEGYGTEGYSCRSLGPKPAHITDAISLQAIGGLESSKKDQVEGFMRIAKRYGNQVQISALNLFVIYLLVRSWLKFVRANSLLSSPSPAEFSFAQLALQVKLVLIGDSITRHLQYDLSCLQKIYSPYELKGLNFGVSGRFPLTTNPFLRQLQELQ